MTTRAIMARCRRIRESRRPLAALAKVYGIRTMGLDDIDGYRKAGGYVAPGPEYSCDPFGRVVFVEPEDDCASPQDTFHEMMHIILALPFHGDNGIDKIDEEAILMQVERAIAQRCLPDKLLDVVYDYQNQTVVNMSRKTERDYLKMPELGAFDNLGQYPKWRDGWKIAKAIGVIDDERWPTFRWPDWPAMGEAGWRRLTER